jgi:hypothetical protein
VNIYIWEVTEPLPHGDDFLCFTGFTKTNTSFFFTLVNPVSGNFLKLYHADSIDLFDNSYILAAFRENPLRAVFHKVII